MAITKVRELGVATYANTSTPTASLVITIPAAGVAAGDSIIISVAVRTATLTGWSATDNGTNSPKNTYTIEAGPINSGAISAATFACHSCSALTSGQTITITIPSALGADAAASEYNAGPTLVLVLDKTHSGTGSGTAPTSGNTAALSDGNELLYGTIGFENLGGGSTFTPEASWTANSGAQATDGANFSAGAFPEYRVLVSTTTAQAATGTLGSSSDWVAIITTYQTASGPQSISASDTGVGVESEQITNTTPSVSDAGTGVENQSISTPNPFVTDSGVGLDTQSILPRPGMVIVGRRPPKLFLAFHAPLTGASITARVDGLDLNPDVTSLQYSTGVGGFLALSAGYAREIHWPGEAKPRQYAGLRREVPFSRFIHVALWDGTRLVWEGRMMLRGKPAGITQSFTAQGYGITALKDGVYLNLDPTKATNGVVLSSVLATAAPILTPSASDLFADPGITVSFSDFDGKAPSAILDQFVKAGTIDSVPLDYAVWEGRRLQLLARNPPATPDYHVPFDDTVTWNETDDDSIGTVILDYTDPVGTKKRIVVTDPTWSDANGGLMRAVPLSGGTMSDPLARQFALTYLASHFDPTIACSIVRQMERPLETPGGGGRSPHLVRALEWIQVGNEALLPIVRTTYDANSHQLTVELGVPQLGYAQRFENLRATQGHVFSNTSPSTGAPR